MSPQREGETLLKANLFHTNSVTSGRAKTLPRIEPRSSLAPLMGASGSKVVAVKKIVKLATWLRDKGIHTKAAVAH